MEEKNLRGTHNGITLISLVITIAILMILSTVGIMLILGEGGLIERANQSKKETEMGAAKEELEIILADAYIEKNVNEKYNENEYLDNFIYEREPDAYIEGDEVSIKGYTFEIDRSVPKIGKYIGEATNLPPTMKIVEKNNNEIKVEVIRAEGIEKFYYTYKEEGEEEYREGEETTEPTYIYKGLEKGKEYELKVEMEKEGKKIESNRKVEMDIGEEIEGEYVQDGLIVHYDGINNTGEGHDAKAKSWKNLAGEKYDGILHGCKWGENYLQTDGIDDWVYIGLMKYPVVTIETVVVHQNSTGAYGVNNFDSGGIGLSDYNKSGYNGLMVYVNGGYKTIDSPTKYKANKIYSLSGSYNGKEEVFYENGKRYTKNLSGSLSYATNTIYALGGNASGESCGMFTKEKIYSVRIYNRALTNEEVLQNYNMDKKLYNFSD